MLEKTDDLGRRNYNQVKNGTMGGTNDSRT